MDTFRSLSEILWSEWFWLPKGYNWSVHSSTAEKRYTDFHWIYFPIPFSIFVLLIRFLCEKYICKPVGRSLGISDRRPKPPPANQILEKEFRKHRKLPQEERIQALCKQLDWNSRNVERWFRQRKALDGQSQLQKFSETGWRFIYYTGIFFYGLITLSGKPWFHSTKYCWIDYPNQEVDDDIWWYYMIELSFYWSLLISQFTDVKRKDFWQMFTHHVTTILLMTFSWVVNLVRVGSIVLIIHDVADVFLEAAKLARYASKPRLCDAIFGVFALVWIVSRLGVYPYAVIRTGLFEACRLEYHPDVECFPAYYVFNALLIILQVLHLIWTYYIVKITVKAIRTGNTDDARSDTDECDDLVEENKELTASPKPKNGVLHQKEKAKAL